MKLYQKIEGKENTRSKINLFYDKGGLAWGTPTKRGLWVTCTFVEIEQSEGFKIEKTAIYGEGNFKVLYAELKRSSDKAYSEACEYIRSIADDLHRAHIAGSAQLAVGLIKNGQAV